MVRSSSPTLSAGSSQLQLSIVSNNEGDGSLHFRDFVVLAAGRDRQINGGTDAQIEIDGVLYRWSSNTVTDLIPGITLSLSDVSTFPMVVNVERDADAIVAELEAFVQAYNSVSEVRHQSILGRGRRGRWRPYSPLG